MRWSRATFGKRKSKFGVRTDRAGVQKRTRNGKVFASQKEARTYDKLTLLELAGEIKELRFQVKFDLKIGDALICRYYADFVYFEKIEGEWREVVDDAKGFQTPEFKLKWKMMHALYPQYIFKLT